MSDNSEKRSNYKVAGIVVATILVLLAVIVSFLGSIKITKKPKVTSNKEVQTEVAQNSDTSVSTSSEKVKEDSKEVSDDDILMKAIRNESKLDYSGKTLTTTGVVSSKSCYLINTQVVYEFDISIGVGSEDLIVKYYCPYDTYNSVNIDDLVTVNYKQVSESAFAVTSVTK